MIGAAESDVNCPVIEDPVRTMHIDGTPVDAGVISPLAGAEHRILRSVLLPLAIAVGDRVRAGGRALADHRGLQGRRLGRAHGQRTARGAGRDPQPAATVSPDLEDCRAATDALTAPTRHAGAATSASASAQPSSASCSAGPSGRQRTSTPPTIGSSSSRPSASPYAASWQAVPRQPGGLVGARLPLVGLVVDDDEPVGGAHEQVDVALEHGGAELGDDEQLAPVLGAAGCGRNDRRGERRAAQRGDP